MIFKLVFNQEIHRVRSELSSYAELLTSVQERLGLAQQGLKLEYTDSDGDNVRINCEEDFAILMEELQGKKTVKVIVTQVEVQEAETQVVIQSEEEDMSIDKVQEEVQEEVQEKPRRCTRGKWFQERFDKKFDESIQKAIP